LTEMTIRPGASHIKTNEVIYGIIIERIDSDSKVLDFGAGAGYMCQRIGNYFKTKGVQPREHIFACEVVTDNFQYKEIDCRKISADSVIPCDDESMDLIYAIEVLEHTRRPYDFIDQAYSKLKGGGWLVFSVPNILHFKSRLKFLLTGFAEMYGPLSSEEKNAGRICGHIMPLNYSHFMYGVKKSGFRFFELFIDRRKKSALSLALPFFPVLKYASHKYNKSLKKYDAEVWKENRDVVKKVNSIDMLSSRSCIIVARK
jgi:SAM-dependent methyltransferase